MISRNSLPYQHLEPFDQFPFLLLTLLIIFGFLIKDNTIICAISMIGLLIAEKGTNNMQALLAVVIFIVSGLVIGPDKGQILGCKKVNLFHYFLGVSMLLFGSSLLN